MNKKHFLSCVFSAVIYTCYWVSPQVLADDGYYPWWRSTLNLTFPPAADNPVTDVERQGDYPLLSNPETFNDGFKPKKYGLWQEINLDLSTGARCGNGSPYKFYINRAVDNRNFLLYLEAGGACWDYESCTGQSGIRGARNPNGIPDNYLHNLETALMSPLIFKLHYRDHPEPQKWNRIYLPYCTGDVHAGDKTVIYEDDTGQNPPLTWHHNGVRNLRAVIAWLRDNMQRPARMMTTGCSAGGAGSLVNYHHIRQDLQPEVGAYLLNDSGPIFLAPAGSSANSQPLHSKIKASWGVQKVLDFLSQDLSGITDSDLGSLNGALANAWPQDRLAHTHFAQDLNYSSYSYERFYPEIENEPREAKRWKMIRDLWVEDTQELIQELDKYDNFSYYIPQFRDLNESHCTTIVEFTNADVQTSGNDVGHFINNLLDDSVPMKSVAEASPQADFNKPLNLFYLLLNELLGAPLTTNPDNVD